MEKRYEKTSLLDISPTPCPCGSARRAFADLPGSAASLHCVEIKQDSLSLIHI